jgi:hypothetical protein
MGHRAWGNTAGSWQKTDILYKELLLHAASCQLQAGFYLLTPCPMLPAPRSMLNDSR